MSDLSRVLRCAALTLALSVTAALAQAQVVYTGSTTNLGTLSSTPTAFADLLFLTAGPNFSFNDTWTFTLPSGSVGGEGFLSSANFYLSTPLTLTVTVDGVPVTPD